MIKFHLNTKKCSKNKPRPLFVLWDINVLALAHFNLKWKSGRDDVGFRRNMRYKKAGYDISILSILGIDSFFEQREYETWYLHCGDFRLYCFCTAEYRFPKLIGCSEAIVLAMEVENSAI